MRTALGLMCCALICWGALAKTSTPAPEESSALALYCNVTSTCLVCTDELQVTEHSHCQKTGEWCLLPTLTGSLQSCSAPLRHAGHRQELECLADDADASHNSQAESLLPRSESCPILGCH